MFMTQSALIMYHRDRALSANLVFDGAVSILEADSKIGCFIPGISVPVELVYPFSSSESTMLALFLAFQRNLFRPFSNISLIIELFTN